MISKPIWTSKLWRGQVNINETSRKLVSHIASHLGLVNFKVASDRLSHIGKTNEGGSKWRPGNDLLVNLRNLPIPRYYIGRF